MVTNTHRSGPYSQNIFSELTLDNGDNDNCTLCPDDTLKDASEIQMVQNGLNRFELDQDHIEPFVLVQSWSWCSLDFVQMVLVLVL